MTPLPPPRLYVIPARSAPVAAVFVRTSGWSMVARWDLVTGRVDHGAWLHGTLYPRRSSLSPDGRLLYTFAMKGGRPYHAISWLPWLTALAFWRDNSTYTSGGFFEDVPARGVPEPDGFLAHPPDAGDATPLLTRHRLRLRAYPTVSYKVERALGWREHEACPPRAPTDIWDERRRVVLYRPSPVGPTRLVLVDSGITHAPGSIGSRRPRYRLDRGHETLDLPGVAWADWDARGRLLVATDLGDLELRDLTSGLTLTTHSLAGVRPTPAPPPPHARHW